jgi:hypothetical protein
MGRCREKDASEEIDDGGCEFGGSFWHGNFRERDTSRAKLLQKLGS